MDKVIVKVGRKRDKGPLFPTTKPIVMGRLLNFGILEAGTESGKTAVAFAFDIGDKVLMVETTAEVFRKLGREIDEAEKMFEAYEG